QFPRALGCAVSRLHSCASRLAAFRVPQSRPSVTPTRSATSPSSFLRNSRQGVVPSLHFPLRIILGKPVAFLNFAFELFLPPVNYVEVIISQPSPLLLGLALKLFPVTCDSVPVHDALPF